MISQEIAEKAKKIKLVVTDIDGVWTDAKMYYTAEGEYMKAFTTYDGMGTYLLRSRGINLAIITGEDSPIVAARAKKLGVEEVFLGIDDKLTVLETLVEKYDLRAEEVAYIGDDVNDYTCMQVAGLTACPSNTPAFHVLKPDILLETAGGDGAFREFVELILSVRDL